MPRRPSLGQVKPGCLELAEGCPARNGLPRRRISPVVTPSGCVARCTYTWRGPGDWGRRVSVEDDRGTDCGPIGACPGLVPSDRPPAGSPRPMTRPTVGWSRQPGATAGHAPMSAGDTVRAARPEKPPGSARPSAAQQVAEVRRPTPAHPTPPGRLGGAVAGRSARQSHVGLSRPAGPGTAAYSSGDQPANRYRPPKLPVVAAIHEVRAAA